MRSYHDHEWHQVWTFEHINNGCYRVAHLLADLGWVDSDLRSSQAGGPLLQLGAMYI